MKRTLGILVVALVTMSWAATFVAAAPSDLRSALRGVRDGTVRLRFAARPGVYGDGRNVFVQSGRHTYIGDGDCCARCTNGPVHVELEMRGGKVEELDHWVGGKERGSADIDLGTVSAPEAADYFLELAAKARPDVGEDAVAVASLADSVEIWPKLVPLARDRKLDSEVRKQALFWLGQAAGESITRTLDVMSRDEEEDVEVRKAAVFALSQRPADEAIATLMRIARSNVHPEVRKSAFFWLAQHDEPEVADFFEKVLLGK